MHHLSTLHQQKKGDRTQNERPHMFRRNSHGTDTQDKTPLFQNRLSRQQKYFFDLGLWCAISNYIKLENNCIHIFKYAALNRYQAHTHFITLFLFSAIINLYCKHSKHVQVGWIPQLDNG